MITAGLDVGRFTDRTALALLDGCTLVDCALLTGLTFREQGRRLLHPLLRAELVFVDATGLGIGLYEVLAELGLPVVAVTLGTVCKPKLHHGGDGLRVGKRHLIGRLQHEVNTRSLVIAPDCPHRQELMHEMQSLTASFTARGNISIAGRNAHDDLPVALALAILARDLSSHFLGGSRANGQAA